MEDAKAVRDEAAMRIHEARVAAKSLLPQSGATTGFGHAHAVALFAKVAADLYGVELLLSK